MSLRPGEGSMRRMAWAWLVAGLVACGGGQPGAARTPPAPAAAGPAAERGGPALEQAAPTATPPPLRAAKLTLPGLGMAHLPLYAARDRGFFAANGMDVETVQLSTDRAVAA